ncbi:MAG: hypothetical protein IJO32_07765 [Bacilli bacterium]|nr:hypothetical protein [Bacilli bacterium]
MNTPKSFGWFHLMWIGLVIISTIFLYIRRNKHNKKQLKIILGIYSITALLLETLKQIIWTFNYDSITNIINWDYQCNVFPFNYVQLPSLSILFFLKEK